MFYVKEIAELTVPTEYVLPGMKCTVDVLHGHLQRYVFAAQFCKGKKD